MSNLEYAYLEDISETWWAWFAGVIIGEGCITVDNRIRVDLKIEICDKEVIETIAEVLRGKVYTRPPSRNRLQASFTWRTGNSILLFNITRKILPYMVGKKRSQLIEFNKLMLLKLSLQQKLKINNRRIYTGDEKLQMLRRATRVRSYAGGGDKSWVQKWNALEVSLKKGTRDYAEMQ